MLTEGENKILEEFCIFKQEFRNIIEALEVRIALKIENINSKVKELEKENVQLRASLELHDRASRKNNLIIFGLERPKENSVNFICQTLNQLLDLNLVEEDFNDVITLGNKKESPIKVELLNFQKKRLILSSCKKLKGSNVIVAHDMTLQQREEHKVLRKHLQKARERNVEHCFIKGNKVFINNKGYTREELDRAEEILEDSGPSNSRRLDNRAAEDPELLTEALSNSKNLKPGKHGFQEGENKDRLRTRTNRNK